MRQMLISRFSDLRNRIQEEYREVVERRLRTITGEPVTGDEGSRGIAVQPGVKDAWHLEESTSHHVGWLGYSFHVGWMPIHQVKR